MSNSSTNITDSATKDLTLSASNLSKIFTGPSGQISVLDGVNFNLRTGNTMSITGPSGSGKSTLLNIIAALIQPTGGKISLGERDYSKLSTKASPQFRAENIGMVFQQHRLIDHLSAIDNILLGAMAAGKVDGEKVRRAELLLDSLAIADRRDHLPRELSGGQAQRVAIARALINSPKLVLADEPTGQLDESCSEDVADTLFKSVTASGAMLIIATHDKALAARADRRYELKHATLVEISEAE